MPSKTHPLFTFPRRGYVGSHAPRLSILPSSYFAMNAPTTRPDMKIGPRRGSIDVSKIKLDDMTERSITKLRRESLSVST